MYREAPRNEIDSGWHFFSGDETQEYADHADNFALYDVNTIANYDPGIIHLLDSPVGSSFGRGENGEFLYEGMLSDPDA